MKRRNLTRNETRSRRYRMFFRISVAVWAVLVVLLVTVPACSKDAPEAVETAIAEVLEQPMVLANYDIPASGYANLDLLECIGTYKVTAYCSCPECCGIWSADHPTRANTDYVQKTASGTIPQAGRTVAADWSVLPQGTEIVMNGNAYIVEDTGNAVVGHHIDLYMDDHQLAKDWGVQHIEIYMEAK